MTRFILVAFLMVPASTFALAQSDPKTGLWTVVRFNTLHAEPSKVVATGVDRNDAYAKMHDVKHEPGYFYIVQGPVSPGPAAETRGDYAAYIEGLKGTAKILDLPTKPGSKPGDDFLGPGSLLPKGTLDMTRKKLEESAKDPKRKPGDSLEKSLQKQLEEKGKAVENELNPLIKRDNEMNKVVGLKAQMEKERAAGRIEEAKRLQKELDEKTKGEDRKSIREELEKRIPGFFKDSALEPQAYRTYKVQAQKMYGEKRAVAEEVAAKMEEGKIAVGRIGAAELLLLGRGDSAVGKWGRNKSIWVLESDGSWRNFGVGDKAEKGTWKQVGNRVTVVYSDGGSSTFQIEGDSMTMVIPEGQYKGQLNTNWVEKRIKE